MADQSAVYSPSITSRSLSSTCLLASQVLICRLGRLGPSSLGRRLHFLPMKASTTLMPRMDRIVFPLFLREYGYNSCLKMNTYSEIRTCSVLFLQFCVYLIYSLNCFMHCSDSWQPFSSSTLPVQNAGNI
jgi:hypothetical protein